MAVASSWEGAWGVPGEQKLYNGEEEKKEDMGKVRQGDRSEGGGTEDESSFPVMFMCAAQSPACVCPTQTLPELAVLSGLKLHFIGHCV